MEKPEWFQEVDAVESEPSIDGTPNEVNGIPRIAKRFVVIGAAALFAAGGVAYAASTIAGSANAVSSTPTTASTPAPAASDASTPVASTTSDAGTPAPNPAASPSSTSIPMPTVNAGAHPSIGSSGEDDGDDDGVVNASAEFDSDGNGDD